MRWTEACLRVPGAKAPQSLCELDVRAEARTYLRSKNEGNLRSKNNGNEARTMELRMFCWSKPLKPGSKTKWAIVELSC